MKIAMLTENYPPALGGDGVHVSDLSGILRRQGHQVKIITKRTNLFPSRRSAKSLTKNLSQTPALRAGVKSDESVRCVGLPGMSLFSRMAFIKLSFLSLLLSDCDLIHAHAPFCGSAAHLAGWLKKKPVVLTVHGYWGPTLNPFGRAVEKKLLSLRYSQIITCDQPAAETVRNINPHVEVHYIPNAVDASLFKPDASAKQQLGLSGKVALFAGRLVPQKGLEPFLRALSKRKDANSITFLIAGSGPEEANLKKIAPKNVTFLGKLEREKLLHYYQASDIFFLPSSWEGLPIALLEAMACGCVPAAFSVGGIGSVVDGSSGLLTSMPQDSLINAIVQTPDAELKMLSSGARAAVLKNYSWKKVSKQIMEVYKKCL